MEKEVYISQQGLEKIKTELAEIENVKLKEIAHKIAEAKDLGDLSENAEYHEAKQTQAFLFGKAQELKYKIKHAKIIQNCLGEAWTAQTNTTHSGGKHTIYSTPDKPTIVSIRYFKDLRSWSKPWQNTISIGDKNNLKSPLQ